jgi:hypothetical protein
MPEESKPFSLGRMGEIVALSVAVGFVVSVIYDWGFVAALGIGFAHIPSTTADHFRSGLLWFPGLVAAFTLYLGLEFQIQRVEGGLTEEEIIARSPNPKRLRRFREGPTKVMLWMAPLGILAYVLMGDAMASGMTAFLIIGWIAFADWSYSAPLIKLRRRRELQVAFTLIPAAGIFAFFLGYNKALDAVGRDPTEVTITSTAEAVASAKLLRTFERGILVLNDNESIEFLPWDAIASIRNKESYTPFKGVLCGWLQICPEDKSRLIGK